MKRIVSVSIGSSARDHRVELELLGEQVVVERCGTDGDIDAAIRRVRELDGRVDAFGLGGIDLYLFVRGRRYTLRDGKRISQAARLTPIVDGSGLKNSLERWIVGFLQDELGVPLAGKNVLMVAAVDRFGMAEALVDAGCQVTFGDLMFALGIPFPIRSLRGLDRLARVAAPIITQLPFRLLYPTGEAQHQVTPKYGPHFAAADIIAGDFHFIRRYMPERLDGKLIVTNTVTEADMEELRKRGVSRLVTTTPNLAGRSFGTNVIEAMLIALAGRPLGPDGYMGMLQQSGFRPRVENLA